MGLASARGQDFAARNFTVRDFTVRDIEALAARLRADDEEDRRAAFTQLSSLPPKALPAIRKRIDYTRLQPIPEEDGYDALRAFRHETGSRRADDRVDIAAGVLGVLKQRRTKIFGRSAERVALLRSLESMGILEAQRAMLDVLALTPSMWRWERKRIVWRTGRAMLPGLILASKYPSRSIQRWSTWGLRSLSVGEPIDAMQDVSNDTLAHVFAAYARVRDFDAMPVVVSFVDHPESIVRAAARDAMRNYGRHGIWQLRLAMEHKLDRTADERWGWKRTMKALYAGLDAKQWAVPNTILDEGLTAQAQGNLKKMARLFDQTLRQAPALPRRAEMTAGYVALGDQHAEARRYASARLAYWRAQHLHGDAPNSAPDLESKLDAVEQRLRAQPGFLERQGDYRVAPDGVDSSAPAVAGKPDARGPEGIDESRLAPGAILRTAVATLSLLVGLYLLVPWFPMMFRRITQHATASKIPRSTSEASILPPATSHDVREPSVERDTMPATNCGEAPTQPATQTLAHLVEHALTRP